MILLDTCCLLWLAGEQQRLSPASRALLGRHEGAIHVSAISALEIGLKVKKGKLRLALPVDEWFARVRRHHGPGELPVSGAIAARSTALPPLHQDPADRILVASAQQQGWALITPDALIRQYPDLTTFWD